MKFCTKCGYKLTGEEKVCPNCGFDLQEKEPVLDDNVPLTKEERVKKKEEEKQEFKEQEHAYYSSKKAKEYSKQTKWITSLIVFVAYLITVIFELLAIIYKGSVEPINSTNYSFYIIFILISWVVFGFWIFKMIVNVRNWNFVSFFMFIGTFVLGVQKMIHSISFVLMEKPDIFTTILCIVFDALYFVVIVITLLVEYFRKPKQKANKNN